MVFHYYIIILILLYYIIILYYYIIILYYYINLKIDKGTKNLEDFLLSLWSKVFSAIKYYIKEINNEEFKTISEVNFNDDYNKIKFISDYSLPFSKLIYFPTITIVIRCVFKQGDLFYPQVYLDDALYQL